MKKKRNFTCYFAKKGQYENHESRMLVFGKYYHGDRSGICVHTYLYANMRLNWISLEPRPCPTREILCRLHMCVETMKISMKYVKTAANFTLSGHGRASNRGWSALRIFQTAASTSYSFRAFQDSTFLICQWFAAKCRVVICQLTAFIGSWMSSQ